MDAKKLDIDKYIKEGVAIPRYPDWWMSAVLWTPVVLYLTSGVLALLLEGIWIIEIALFIGLLMWQYHARMTQLNRIADRTEINNAMVAAMLADRANQRFALAWNESRIHIDDRTGKEKK